MESRPDVGMVTERPRWAVREASARASAALNASAVAWDMFGAVVWIPRTSIGVSLRRGRVEMMTGIVCAWAHDVSKWRALSGSDHHNERASTRER